MSDRLIEFVCVAVATLVVSAVTVALVAAAAMTPRPAVGEAVLYDGNFILDALSVPNYAIVMLFGLIILAAGMMRTRTKAKILNRH